MKKALLCLILIITPSLLLGCSKQEQTDSPSTSLSSTSSTNQSEKNSSSKTNDQNQVLKMSIPEIKKGDLKSIQGTWLNKEGKSFKISDHSVSGDISGTLSAKDMTSEENHLSMILQYSNPKSPASSNIPFILYPSGETIKGSTSDLSDKNKDRIVITNGGLTSEQTETEVYYHQSDFS